MSITERELRLLEGEALRDLADRVGVGYADLDDDTLRHKIRFEGRPENL